MNVYGFIYSIYRHIVCVHESLALSSQTSEHFRFSSEAVSSLRTPEILAPNLKLKVCPLYTVNHKKVAVHL